MENRLSVIEADIGSHEKRIENCGTAMTEATQQNDRARIIRLSKDIHKSEQAIECLFNEMETLSAHYETQKMQFDQQLTDLDGGI